MKTKKIAGLMLIAILGGLIAVFAYSHFVKPETKIITARTEQPFAFTNLPAGYDSNELNFIYAAELSVHGVVHVKTQSTRTTYYQNPLYEFFYGERYTEQEPVIGFGSGVIISKEGYIVTNNHVIDKSEKIYVTLNDNREFEAELVGTDPSTDLAVLRIKADNIMPLKWGDSDALRLGEWVMAVGNPYNLTSSVTAGIVSAKGRSLNIIQDDFRIESFIQTDAALNRGNSGGALVNLKGELVGVNTAILSPSGGYAGNSFAVPVAIVRKVVEDLIEFGEVQRAILGVNITDVTTDLAKEENIQALVGVYITGLREDGAAKDAGIKVGDLVSHVNGVEVNSVAELQEQISRYRPKEKITITVIRDNKKKQFDVILRNMQGTTEIVRADDVKNALGATFAKISNRERQNLGISHGVKVTDLGTGKLREAGVRVGFVLTKINEQPVHSVSDIKRIIDSIEGGVYIEGVYPNGEVRYYAFPK
ncbi:MAG: Do family serine endopeptidase [Bacteroidota bacterium]